MISERGRQTFVANRKGFDLVIDSFMDGLKTKDKHYYFTFEVWMD